MSELSDAALARLRQAADWPEVDPDRYEILGTLGRGGMGTVWRARDRALDRDVALKVLHEDVARAEARTLARLEHPGIVPVHDAGVLPDGRPWYTMKLVRGQRLDELAPGMALHELLRTLDRVADAVAFAHAAGVVHRDLKPENVMVGAFGDVLVMDWGIAVEAGAAGDGVRVGTPGFMSPEQEAGGPVDARSDVFALGATLDALLAGRGAPRRLTAIATAARHPDPARRYPDAAAFAADVRRFTAGEPVAAYRESPLERAGRLFVKYQTPIVLILVYLLVRALFIIVP